MASFPKVSAGQVFKPLVTLENTLREIASNSQTISTGRGSKLSSSTLISVFNSTENAIGAGCAVNFIQSDDDTFDDEIIPCAAISDASQTWGIVKSRLDPGEIGSCVISGPVKVKISGSNGDYVQPDINTPGVFVTSSNGVPIVFRHGAEAIINLGGGSGGATAHQFRVIDSSTKNAGGNITQHKVSVVNGHAPGNATAGYINNKPYPATILDLAATGTFYIYAIDGAIYALKHTYASDMFPVVLLATVVVTNSVPVITQESFADNIIVPVQSASVGGTTITYTLSVAQYVLTATYSVTAEVFFNSTKITTGNAIVLPEAESGYGYFYAYVDKIVVPANESPVCGFSIEDPGVAQSGGFQCPLLRYKLTDTEFEIKDRSHELYLFSFARLYIPSTVNINW